MSGIVCALRGGPASQPTIQRAIRLALETGLPIHFLYVVNLDFLSRTASIRTQTIEEQMRQMGEFILLAAQTQASQIGVQADSTIRDGRVDEQIIALCRETEAEYVVLGRPQADKQANVFDPERLERFRVRLAEQTGARVILSDNEK